jgi:hypothetical protein
MGFAAAVGGKGGKGHPGKAEQAGEEIEHRLQARVQAHGYSLFCM